MLSSSGSDVLFSMGDDSLTFASESFPTDVFLVLVVVLEVVDVSTN